MDLFFDEYKCCGCEACANICPKQAITMEENDKGFLYPKIEESKCIHCNKCISVCNLKDDKLSNMNLPKVYAAVNNNKEELHTSASGGVFSALARWAIEHDGVVFGCSWNSEMLPYHTQITKISELEKLQGSKYVQSRIGQSYREVKKQLDLGKLVLFSGTPCQCDGLRSYLKKNYEKLICIELICHGVPSSKFFKDYVSFLEKKIKGKIFDIKFRDKKRGWGALLHIIYKNARGDIKHKFMSTDESYYYHYYWGGNLYRDSCYQCKYACLYRQSDFTIGDYWGIQRAHPSLDSSEGASVLLVNTQKGKALLPILEKYMKMIPSTIEDAKRENGQLVSASSHQLPVDRLWELYKQGGAEALDQDYRARYRSYIIKGKVKRMVPVIFKKLAKKLIMR